MLRLCSMTVLFCYISSEPTPAASQLLAHPLLGRYPTSQGRCLARLAAAARAHSAMSTVCRE